MVCSPLYIVANLKSKANKSAVGSKLAEVLKALGAEEPGDLVGLGEDDITDLRALVAEMKTIPKRRFEAALTKILSVPE